MERREFRIEGMTCGHCVAAVTAALSALEGVSGVEVDLEAGSATVTSDEEFDHAAVGAAIHEAGYELAA